MRMHLRTAALAGTSVGMVVGVAEAVGAARAARQLTAPADFWPVWIITVGLYAAIGWAAFGGLGLVVGVVAGCSRRLRPEKVRLAYYSLGAMALPAGLFLAHPSDSPVTLVLLWLEVGVVAVAAGAAVWFGAGLARGRLGVKPAGAGSLLLGCFVAGGFWARWGADGLSAVEGLGSVTAGLAVAVAAYGWSVLRARGIVSGGPSRASHGWLLLLWPVPFLAGIAWLGMRIGFPAAPRGAPNVLLITVDALRADRLGSYGSKRNLTPNLDRFAQDAVVFEKAFTSAPWTAASMGAAFTSLYPSELGLVPVERDVRHNRYQGGLFTPQPTLAEVLRRAGYVTAAELSNPQIRRDRGFARGFITFRNPDDFYAGRTPGLPRLDRYASWFLQTSVGERVARAVLREPRFYRAGNMRQDDAERLVRDADAWLDARPERPFFLWVHLMDSHVPYNSQHASGGTRAAFPRPPFEGTAEFYKELVWTSARLTDPGKRYLQALYNDEVRHADLWLGRLLERLRRRNLYDNTLIVITADHGEEFWDHGGFEHGHTMYDELLHVPLLVRLPRGAHAGERVSEQARLMDLLPTVLQGVGLPNPGGVRGRSLLELLGGGRAHEDRVLFAEATLYGEERKALRTPAYKVIFHTESRALEVYDLRADPAERVNLAADPRVAADLRERLMRLARESERRTAWWVRFGQKAPPLDQRSLERLRSIGYAAN